MPYAIDPIINSFAAFANICITNNEKPFFKYDYEEMNKFFYEMKQEYPKEFEMVFFNTNGCQPLSNTIDEAEMDMLICGYMYSYSPRFNPHLISKEALKRFNELEDSEIYLDIAKRLYDKFGCDENGNIGKHTKFNGLENII
jgi:hypothetical protein